MSFQVKSQAKDFNQNHGIRFRPEGKSSDSAAWFHPFADASAGQLTKKQWGFIVVGFVFLHLLALQVSTITGNFEANPNSDHVHYMWQVLERGYPTPALWPPGFSYYLTLKWVITQAMGLPYWSGKYFVDVFPVILAGILSIVLAQTLTKNRFLAIASGVGLICAPIYILGVAKEEAAIFFQPFFLLSLLLLVKELQRQEGPRLSHFAIAGAIMGLASLIRGNPQFIIVVIAVFVLFVLHRTLVSRQVLRAVVLLAVFLCAQAIIMSPWSFLQKRVGKEGVFSASVYELYFDGVKRHPGNRVSDWLREHHQEPKRAFQGVIDFNLTWLKKDPVALAELYALKFVRAWYMSDSGRWDKPTLFLHFPLWIFALLGVWRWRKTARCDPAYVFILLIILYMWTVSAVLSGIARYSAPVYGFIGLLGGVFFLPYFQKHSATRPSCNQIKHKKH